MSSNKPRSKRGTVHLVGAGPGDPGLLTLRAARLLRRADVVVHDALVGEGILDLIPPTAERIDVGKRCGGRRTSQEEINEMLIRSVRTARTVVRLKGGDPFVFGRGGEEAIALQEAGVRFRVVPGITAAVGVSAYAGIPLTHRDFASSVTFVTGHGQAHRGGDRIDWDALARLGGTLAIYMGVGGLSRIADRLVSAGRPRTTPAAVIEWGTHARQRTVHGSLEEIAATAAEAGIGAPALVVIGEVAALRDRLAWFDQLPLRGVRVLVGRSRPQPSRIARALSRLGAEVHEHPKLRSAAAPRPAEIDRAFAALAAADWVVFSSPAAVNRFWAEALERGLDARALGGVRIAAVGRATASALGRRGIVPDVRTRTFETTAIETELTSFGSLDGAAILFPREGHLASPIAVALRERGAAVQEVEFFRTVLYDALAELPADVLPEVDAVVLPSSTAARTIAEATGAAGLTARVVAIGPKTAAAAESHGLTVDVTAGDHTVAGVVRSVLDVTADLRASFRSRPAEHQPLLLG